MASNVDTYGNTNLTYELDSTAVQAVEDALGVHPVGTMVVTASPEVEITVVNYQNEVIGGARQKSTRYKLTLPIDGLVIDKTKLSSSSEVTLTVDTWGARTFRLQGDIPITRSSTDALRASFTLVSYKGEE